MSNRAALRKLTRHSPTPPEILKVMEGLKEEKDMSIAMVGASLIEAALERLIRAKIHSKSTELVGSLFTNRGPLSDFHSKILIAEAFGIITSPLALELQTIKVVRNAFAHARTLISFDHELISNELKASNIRIAIEGVDIQPGESLPQVDDRGWFLLLIELALMLLDALTRHPGNAYAAMRSFRAGEA